MNIKKAFTLVEIMIVLVIFGLLMTVLFQSYIVISQISFRTEQEKLVGQELLFFSQNLQNLVDRNPLDLDQYDSNEMITNNWFTDTLYFSGQDGQFSITTQWDWCREEYLYELPKALDYDAGGCWFVLSSGDVVQQITDMSWVVFSQVKFKIIPYASNESYLEWDIECWNYFSCLNSPWFWIFTRAMTPYYRNNWYNSVDVFFQEFFTSRVD